MDTKQQADNSISELRLSTGYTAVSEYRDPAWIVHIDGPDGWMAEYIYDTDRSDIQQAINDKVAANGD